MDSILAMLIVHVGQYDRVLKRQGQGDTREDGLVGQAWHQSTAGLAGHSQGRGEEGQRLTDSEERDSEVLVRALAVLLFGILDGS